MYSSSMATGQVSEVVLAMTTSFPCLYWSVLLLGILIVTPSWLSCKSHGRILANSSYLKNPATPSKHAVASLILVNLLFFLASCTIARNISGENGTFFCTGLAHALFRPSRVARTSGSSGGETKPAKVWTHDRQFTASSTAALDCSRGGKD